MAISLRSILASGSAMLKSSEFWTVVLLLVLVALVTVVVLSFRNPYPGVPLAPHWTPVLGHLLSLKPRRFHTQMEEWAQELGVKNFQLQLLTTRILIVTGKKQVLDIVKNRPGRFKSLPALFQQFIDAGFDGVLSADGDDWARHRRFVAPAFNSAKLRSMLDPIKSSYNTMVSDWVSKSKQGEYVDVKQHFHRLTCHVILRIAFAFDVDEHAVEADELVHAVERLFDIFGDRMFFPIPVWKVYRRKVDIELDTLVNKLHALSNATIEHRLKEYESNSKLNRPEDLLDRLLKAHSQGEKLSTQEVVGNLLTFFVAGQDTTANALAFTMYLLATHPHKLAKLRAEIDAAVANKGSLDNLLLTIDTLPYLLATMKEAMRVRTIAPMFPLSPAYDLKLGDEIPCRGGDYLIVIASAVHKDPAAFHEPTSFTPERWLPNYPHTHDDEMYHPFGGGPRTCPGQQLSRLEYCITIGSIVYNYEFALKPGHEPVGESLNLSNSADKPVEFTFTPRHE